MSNSIKQVGPAPYLGISKTNLLVNGKQAAFTCYLAAIHPVTMTPTIQLTNAFKSVQLISTGTSVAVNAKLNVNRPALVNRMQHIMGGPYVVPHVMLELAACLVFADQDNVSWFGRVTFKVDNFADASKTLYKFPFLPPDTQPSHQTVRRALRFDNQALFTAGLYPTMPSLRHCTTQITSSILVVAATAALATAANPVETSTTSADSITSADSTTSTDSATSANSTNSTTRADSSTASTSTNSTSTSDTTNDVLMTDKEAAQMLIALW